MAILDFSAISENGTYTPVAGSDRVVVFIGSGEGAYSSRYIHGLTFGGVVCTPIITNFTNKVKAGAWILKESEIPNGQSVLSVDWDGAVHEGFEGVAYTLGGIDQLSPVNDSVDGDVLDHSLGIDLVLASAAGSPVLLAVASHNKYVQLNKGVTDALSNVTLTTDRRFNASEFALDVLSISATPNTSNAIGVRSLGTGTGELTAVGVSFNEVGAANNIDTDNNIDQFQRDVALNHSLASPLTSVLINNVEHIDLIQNSDAELKYIKRCYDAIGSDVTSVILKNGVDTDVTIPSVTVNTTHPYPVPNEAVDSNSMFSGVTVSGSNASFRITSAPTKGTLDLSDPAKYLHDVDASKGGVYTPNPGATGTDSFTFEVHDPDEPVALNRTQSGTVTINIAELGLPISGSAAFSFPNFQFPILDTTH